MNGQEQIQNINFTIDTSSLYREESITDLKVGSIRRLIPVKTDGLLDEARPEVFIGHTQLMSPEGPLPIQSELDAKSLKEAIEVFPATMKQALAEMIEKIQQMQQQQQQQTQPKDESRIIVPGR